MIIIKLVNQKINKYIDIIALSSIFKKSHEVLIQIFESVRFQKFS